MPLRPAKTAEDAHSKAEQAVYDALWKNATPESNKPDSPRTIRIGYDRLAKLTRLKVTSAQPNTKPAERTLSVVRVRANLKELDKKKAIEVVEKGNSAKRQGTLYRIYPPAEILKRRQRAGLQWVRRTRGVKLLDSPQQERIEALVTGMVGRKQTINGLMERLLDAAGGDRSKLLACLEAMEKQQMRFASDETGLKLLVSAVYCSNRPGTSNSQ